MKATSGVLPTWCGDAWHRAVRLADEAVRGIAAGSDASSRLRLGLDPLLQRAMRHSIWVPGRKRVRTVRVGCAAVSYRLNPGDIQSIREVLIDEVYRPPFQSRPRVIVDLGANIGLTSLYYSLTFAPECVVAVEPDPENAALARRNLAGYGVTIIEAAIAAEGGTTRFASSAESNLGRVSTDGDLVVRAVTMPEVIALCPGNHVDLLKIDIEGGEGALFEGDCSWLTDVSTIIAELHPDAIDTSVVIDCIAAAGFCHIPAGSAWPGSMDAWTREAAP